jgi:hypothetical protein
MHVVFEMFNLPYAAAPALDRNLPTGPVMTGGA